MAARDGVLASFEAWRVPAFLLGGVLFVANAALVAANIASGTQDPALTLGQAFVGAGWTCAFVGLRIVRGESLALQGGMKPTTPTQPISTSSPASYPAASQSRNLSIGRTGVASR
jgi:hypothetical protein